MKNVGRILSFSVMAIVAGLYLGGCKKAQSDAPPSAAGAVAVSVQTLALQPVQLSVELPGRTDAYRVAEVRPQVSGIVQKRLFTEGREVKAGELLYQIDAASYEAAFAGAEAALAKAEAMEYSARLKASRYQTLVRTKAVSEQEQIETEAGWKQAEAEVAAAKAALQTAGINLNYTRITAPIAGRIGRSLISEGALVTAQQALPLATIQQLDPLYVDVNQSANELLKLKRKLAAGQEGTNRQLQTEVKVILDDAAEYSETGILEFSDASVNQSTGTVTIRAIIANPRNELLPGMFVRARLTSTQQHSAILVPQSAIVRNSRGEATVMLMDDQEKVEARPVETGQNFGDQVMITKGLAAGDRLIIAGLQKIRPGVTVRVETHQPGAEPPAAPTEQSSAKKVE